MSYAVFPRTPGRDYAGIVIDGPAGMIGREVFGSSGDLGIRRDGSHATHLAVEADAVVEKPASLSWEQAAGLGVPFVTAMEGFRRAGMPKKTETVLVMGVNGKVGQAAVQIATWHGARAVGVVRKNEPYEGHANSKVDVIDASATDVAARLRDITDGKGADIVFNTVGDPYFQAAHQALALRGRQILIAAIAPVVPFNILEFYRGQHTYVGIDTLGLSSVATGAVLKELVPGLAEWPSQAVSDPVRGDLFAAGRQGCLSRGRRLVARSRDPASGAIARRFETVCCRQFCRILSGYPIRKTPRKSQCRTEPILSSMPAWRSASSMGRSRC